MATERASGRPRRSDEELREALLNDPDVRRRLAEALERAKQPDSGPGITEAEMPEFLREHG